MLQWLMITLLLLYAIQQSTCVELYMHVCIQCDQNLCDFLSCSSPTFSVYHSHCCDSNGAISKYCAVIIEMQC